MSNICNKCSEAIVARAFSEGTCWICDKNIVTPHIPNYKICGKCAVENNLCKQCGKIN